MNYAKKIQNTAAAGVIVSLVAVVIAILFKYVSKNAFYQNPEVYRTWTIIGVVFAILELIVIMRGIKRSLPKIREKEDPQERLKEYCSMVTTNAVSTVVVTLIVTAIIIMTGNFTLLMLDMMLVLMLFFTYPNMYKIKVDLGLDDTVMKQLFGEKYVADPVEDAEAEVIDESTEEPQTENHKDE